MCDAFRDTQSVLDRVVQLGRYSNLPGIKLEFLTDYARHNAGYFALSADTLGRSLTRI